MKYRVAIEGVLFEVEVDDLNTRPIIASIDGERFEVWPEAVPELPSTLATAQSRISGPLEVDLSLPAASALPQQVDYDFEHEPDSPSAGRTTSVLAPIPGTIISIGVKAGQRVTQGQELCVLDAMKMESPIRAPRPGKIREIFVAEGENVKYHQLLMEYGE
jgi:biotin carboxyl carrier protein